MLAEWVVDKIKNLPGVSYVLTATTYLGALALSDKELSGLPLLFACAACAAAYKIGSALDGQLYDRLYAPRKNYPLLPQHKRLKDARNALARHVFQGRGVRDYLDAVGKGLLADPDIHTPQEPPGLYALASSAAKSSTLWDKHIAGWHDVSKAARSFLVLSSSFLVLLVLVAVAPAAIPAQVTLSLSKMGFLGTAIPYLALFPAMLWGYLSWRALHQALLYELVTKNAEVLALPSGAFMLLIPEVRFH